MVRDSFRQLFLLLWKNVVLRKRRKIRLIIELVWPLFLFIILVLVRTRGLRRLHNQCHFAERALPSAGILPFFRSYVCELNNSCANTPREIYDNKYLFELTQLTTDTIGFLERPGVSSSIRDLSQFVGTFPEQINQVSAYSKNITLAQSINGSSESFKTELNTKGLFVLNNTIQDLILDSNPNFKYLYSNYSQDYNNLLNVTNQFNLGSDLINFIYGDDFQNIDANRPNNRVDDPQWIRSRYCLVNDDLLLRGKDSIYLQSIICSLSDNQLSTLFIYISSSIDFSKVRNQILVDSTLSNLNTFAKFQKAYQDIQQLQKEYNESNLMGNNGNTLSDFLVKLQNIEFGSSICGRSPLSIFSIGFLRYTFRSRPKDYKRDIEDIDYYDYFYIPREASDDIADTIHYTNVLIAYNNINKLDRSKCSKSRVNPYSEPTITDLLINSTTQSCFCKTFYSIFFSQSQESSYLFSQIAPMILGKILYTPNTPAYQKLIKKMNQTFQNIYGISLSMSNLASLTNDILTQLNLTTNGNINQFIQNVNQIAAQFNIDLKKNGFDLEKFIYQTIFAKELFKFIHNALDCFETNKFAGFATEDEAVKKGLKLIDNLSFWSVIVFNNPEKTDPVTNEKVLPKIVSYKIRMNSSHTHDTRYTQDKNYNFGPTNCMGCNAYFLYGFIYIQDMLEKAIVEMKTNEEQDIGMLAQMVPYPCYIQDRFIDTLSSLLPLFMVIAWIYTVSMIVKDIVYEKEKKLKEFMRVMGLTNGIHWCSWFITAFVIMFFITIILCIILKFGKVLTNSDFSVLIVFFLCFTIATVTQCFLISVFFNKANLAAVVAGIIYFLLYLPYTLLLNYADVILPWQKFLASLSSTVAFSYGCQLIASFELQTVGANWQNFYSTPYTDNDQVFSLNTICLIMLLDAALYMILAWYIEGIMPGEYGIPRKLYFPFQPSYWCGESNSCTAGNKLLNKLRSSKANKIRDLIRKPVSYDKESDLKENKDDIPNLNTNIEKVNIDEEIGIEIKNLHKVYSRGNNHALKGLTVNFYKNEISAFLGHNGAGKSTTIHLLTGLYSPTSGTAKINGLDITKSMDFIRKSIGFVPQHNILFDDMTVREHLWFYARLKGLDRKSTKEEIEKMLEDTGLTVKKNDAARTLSGGMQRKLSVMISFVGGSKTVILDEPSAGVDPSGRRSIWDLLFKYRQGRTIIISTHHLDEADVLGDRVAIISNGQLIAHGTSFFLKNQFGRGYYLTLIKKPVTDDQESNETEEKPKEEVLRNNLANFMRTNLGRTSHQIETNHSNLNENSKVEKDQLKKEQILLEEVFKDSRDKKIHDFMVSRIPNAILVENKGIEMTYCIPNQKEYTSNYEEFFADLEAKMVDLNVESLGLADTTLEEIFIKLAKQPEKNSYQDSLMYKIKNKLGCLKNKNEIKGKFTEAEVETFFEYTKLRVSNKLLWILMQLMSLLVKRFHRVKRNIKGFFCEIILPIIFICLALLASTLNPGVQNRPSLELHPWYYNEPNRMFVSESNSLNYKFTLYDRDTQKISLKVNPSEQPNVQVMNKIKQSFINNGLGTRCAQGYKLVLSTIANDFASTPIKKPLDCDEASQILQNYTFPNDLALDGYQQTNFQYTKYSLDCDCSSGFPECTNSSGGDIKFQPIYKLKSKDIMYDLSSRNISDWVIKTEFKSEFFRRRFAGFELMQPSVNSETPPVNTNILVGFERFLSLLSSLTKNTNLNVSNTSVNNDYSGSYPFGAYQTIKIWYNTKGYDASVSSLNVLNNAILRSKLNSNEHAIVAYNHPMNYTTDQFISQLASRTFIDLFVAICVIFALSFIPASFLVFLLEERETNTKQLQFVSGVKPFIYWISNFLWDLLNYVIPCLLCVALFVIFDVKSYTSKQNFPCMISLMLLYGFACIPLMYPLNYLFSVPSTAFVLSACLNIFIGVVSTMTTTVIDQLGDDEEELKDINKYLKPIFTYLLPHYCLGNGFIQMAKLYLTSQVQLSYGVKKEYYPFSMDNIGPNLISMAVQGCVFFTFNLLLQYRFFIRFKPTKDLKKLKLPKPDLDDDDVINEKNRIQDLFSASSSKNTNKFKSLFKKIGDSCNIFKKSKRSKQDSDDSGKDFIKIVNLTKIYKKFQKYKLKKHCAVNSLSLGIDKGECFGLIGVNGAGKTTTFKMITGEIPISGGDVYVNNYSVSKQIHQVHRNIGYCPQTDAIMPLLTAREHLIFFARLRGIPNKYVGKVTEWALHRVGLKVFADRIAKDFSGGNKRKLSTAIALIGNPSVICLDEPTSGMDAKARRLLWNDINSLIKENRIVILTSHSMEECEALCTRLVIMVNGQFKCLGSPQYLKIKYGSGFTLKVRLNDENDREKLTNFMNNNFPTSTIREAHKSLFEYNLPFKDTRLSYIFGTLEKNRDYLGIKDYSLGQTTLDQIFVNFAKAQKEDGFTDNAIEYENRLFTQINGQQNKENKEDTEKDPIPIEDEDNMPENLQTKFRKKLASMYRFSESYEIQK